VIAIAVVWISYLLVDPQLRWTTPSNLPPAQGIRALIDWIPLPETYRDGMRIQFGFEDQTWGGYLFGQYYQGPRWYYQPAAFLIKTPLGMLALGLAGAVVTVASRRLRPAAPYLLVPPAVLFAVAMTDSRNLGDRYVIFTPMFLAVVAAGMITLRRARIAAAALALTVTVSSLRTFPYYLPYSNEAFGGPSNTHFLLHDSNVDWGQDLGRLADRLKQGHPHDRIWLVYKGSGVPAYYGITAEDPLSVPSGQVHGLLVVSDSAVAKADARLRALIDTSTPIDEVGHAITIYRRP